MRKVFNKIFLSFCRDNKIAQDNGTIFYRYAIVLNLTLRSVSNDVIKVDLSLFSKYTHLDESDCDYPDYFDGLHSIAKIPDNTRDTISFTLILPQ